MIKARVNHLSIFFSFSLAKKQKVPQSNLEEDQAFRTVGNSVALALALDASVCSSSRVANRLFLLMLAYRFIFDGVHHQLGGEGQNKQPHFNAGGIEYGSGGF